MFGRDAALFVRSMQLESVSKDYQKLSVAPIMIKQRLCDLLDEQIALARAGRPACAYLKTNSVTDRDIIENYDNYDGFVILHGTDTMAYTAAALSYLIQNSPKPIVLTGSQQPMANPFTDAKLNLYHSVLYAIDEKSCGVVVVFGNEVIAGTRAHKQRTLSFNAFTSMNFPALAHIRGNQIIRSYTGTDAGIICLDEKAGSQDSRTHAGLQTYTKLNERVIVLKLTPELNPSIFYLLKRDYDAIVLETFGIGGIPDHDGEYEKAINDWISSGRIIVVTTQVPEDVHAAGPPQLP